MKALTLRNPSLTKEILLRKADETPGAWIGIRIAGLLLILSGWKSTQVAELFGLTRWAVVKWIQKANSSGVETVADRARSGRPPRLDEDVLNKLDEALSKSPKDFGIPRAKWDGVVICRISEEGISCRDSCSSCPETDKEIGIFAETADVPFCSGQRRRGGRISGDIKKNSGRL